jgi:hypothetical protein
MTADFRKLCEELAGWIERSTRHYIRDPDVLIRARAALADHVPDTRKMVQPPADGEVAEPTSQELYDLAAEYDGEPVASMRAALARWAPSTPQPVPVSERLPGAGDRDAEGKCWWWYPPVPEQNYGYWLHEDDATERALEEWPTHWLPAHALPLPDHPPTG